MANVIAQQPQAPDVDHRQNLPELKQPADADEVAQHMAGNGVQLRLLCGQGQHGDGAHAQRFTGLGMLLQQTSCPPMHKKARLHGFAVRLGTDERCFSAGRMFRVWGE